MNKLLPKSLIKNKKPYCELCSKDLTRAKMPCWCDDCRVCIESYLQELGQEQWIQEGYAKGKADTLEAVEKELKSFYFKHNVRCIGCDLNWESLSKLKKSIKELKSEPKEKEGLK